MKSVALFDFDNTLYEGFSYFDLVAKQVQEGLVAPEVLAEANQSMQLYRNSDRNYEETIVSLLDIYARGLNGKSYDDVYGSTYEFYRDTKKVYGFARKVFELLSTSHDICLVTGEPQFIAASIADVYGLDDYYSTDYEVVEGRFTGSIKSYLASRHEKHNAVEHLLQGHQIEGSFAFGDAEGDIEMLAAVNHPVCIKPNPGLRARASEHGWPCVEPDQVESLVRKILAG
jgi:HAD superfamily hydrolase (TIGR01490 family)